MAETGPAAAEHNGPSVRPAPAEVHPAGARRAEGRLVPWEEHGHEEGTNHAEETVAWVDPARSVAATVDPTYSAGLVAVGRHIRRRCHGQWGSLCRRPTLAGPARGGQTESSLGQAAAVAVAVADPAAAATATATATAIGTGTGTATGTATGIGTKTETETETETETGRVVSASAMRSCGVKASVG